MADPSKVGLMETTGAAAMIEVFCGALSRFEVPNPPNPPKALFFNGLRWAPWLGGFQNLPKNFGHLKCLISNGLGGLGGLGTRKSKTAPQTFCAVEGDQP